MTVINLDDFNELLESLEVTKKRPLLIGIDGRPCSGKSTLADLLINNLNATGLFLDDFFIPQAEWPSNIGPAFPFLYFRYEEFLQGISRLANGKEFEYQPYNWVTNKVDETRKIDPKNVIIIEGVSVLNKKLRPYLYKKIVVMSTINDELEAICQRENDTNIEIWKELYIPSINIYWKTKPWEHADILYAGRGVKNKESIIEQCLKFE